MYFDSVNAALTMEGHGAFVWSAYVITFLVLAFMLVQPLLRGRRLAQAIRAEQRRQAAELPAEGGGHAP